MAKQGMHREREAPPHAKNKPFAVPQIQGKAKSGKEKARPIIAGTESANLKVYHSKPHAHAHGSEAHSAVDNDLARDNMENDLPIADLQD